MAMGRPVRVIQDFWGASSGAERIRKAILDVLDLRPVAIRQKLGLRKVRYLSVAAYGYFGRPDLDLLREKTDHASVLRAAAGLA